MIMSIKSLLINRDILGKRQSKKALGRWVPAQTLGDATSAEIKKATKIIEIIENIENDEDYNIQIYPAFDGNKIAFSDNFSGVTTTVMGMAAACATSYGIAKKYTHAEQMATKDSDLGIQMTTTDVMALSLGGWFADKLFTRLTNSVLGLDVIKAVGITTLASGIENKQTDVASAEIIKQIEDSPSYKDSGISGAKTTKLFLNILNAGLLGYHGYKRSADVSNDYKGNIVNSATWFLGGYLGLTNLGLAAAQGFAKPCVTIPKTKALTSEI